MNRFNPPIRFILTIAALWLACISAIAGSKGNPGSSAFRGAHFKPTVIINHDAVKTSSGTATLKTYAAYDALYRPLKTETEYEPGQFAKVDTVYGAVANGKEARQKDTTDDRGKVVRTLADGLGRTLAVTDGFGTALAATTTTEYSSTGFAWKTIDPLGRESESDFDAAGRVVAQWSPDPTTTTGLVNRTTPTDLVSGSPVTRTAYDKNSNVTVTVNPLGARHEFVYDARNRKIEERQPEVVSTEIINGSPVSSILAQPLIETAFDDVGNVIAVTDARGNTTRTFHDKAYRVTHMVSNPVTGNPSSDLQNLGANDIVVQSIFDPNGNVIEAIDANGNATRNQYDSLNRLVATASNPSDGQPNAPPASPKADDIVVLSERDDAGNLVKVTDGEGRITEFRQDGMGRKTRTIWDAGSAVEHVEEFAFDGLVQTSRTDPMGRVSTYQYDARHRLIDVLYTGASADNRHYSYDLLGNQLSVTYPNETANMQAIRGTAQTFDHLNRAITETSTGVTHSYGYDRANNRVSTTYGVTGRTLHSSYDRQNRLLICTESGDQATYYFYDHNSNVTRKVLPSGAEKRAVFDALNRRLIDSDLAPNGSVVSSFDYSQPQGGYPSGYDSVGNLMQAVESYGHASVKNRTVTNSYDRGYRLATETIVETGGSNTLTAYQYDKGNNRTQKSITVDGGAAVVTNSVYGTTTDGFNSNQLKSATTGSTTTEFSYDLNGNRGEKKVNGVIAQTYSWDHENRLSQLVEAGTGTFSYAYDHRTRRVLRDESQAGGQSTVLTFSGGLSVQEYPSGGSTPTVEYIRGSDYGGGIGGILYTIRGGNRSYNAYNSRGDVVSQTDDSGAITWQSSYEAFGTRTQEQGTTQDRQKANTKDEDETGLLNEGSRYRDLEFGVFLSRDPAGLIEGPNTYTFVAQNPWSSFDPDGLFFRWIHKNIITPVAKPVGEALGKAAVETVRFVGGDEALAASSGKGLDNIVKTIEVAQTATIETGEFIAPVSSETIQKVEDGDYAGAMKDVGTDIALGKVNKLKKLKNLASKADEAAELGGKSQKIARTQTLSSGDGHTMTLDFKASTPKPVKSKKGGRSGKQARIRAIADDPKASSADRGWVRNEKRRIKFGNGSKTYRLPRNGRKSPGRKGKDKGYELAHPHNAPASKGNSYKGSKLKNHADHKVETRLHKDRY